MGLLGSRRSDSDIWVRMLSLLIAMTALACSSTAQPVGTGGSTGTGGILYEPGGAGGMGGPGGMGGTGPCAAPMPMSVCGTCTGPGFPDPLYYSYTCSASGAWVCPAGSYPLETRLSSCTPVDASPEALDASDDEQTDAHSFDVGQGGG